MSTRRPFLINEPYHKRWELDKGGHYWYNGVIYGDTLHCSVIQASTGRTVESKNIKLEDGWEAKSFAYQDEMKKAYGD